MLRFVLTSTIFSSAPVMADCPRHVSDVAGIELSRAEPFLASVYRQSSEGLTEVRVQERNGAMEGFTTVYAHPLAPEQQVTRNGTLTLAYGDGTSKLDRLDKAGSWVTGVALKVDGETVSAGRAAKRFLGTEMIDVGNCRTEVWLVEDRLNLGLEDETYMVLSYAPELGLVVRSMTMAADGTPLRSVEFDQVRELAD